jgi:hypothetical protein
MMTLDDKAPRQIWRSDFEYGRFGSCVHLDPGSFDARGA